MVDWQAVQGVTLLFTNVSSELLYDLTKFEQDVGVDEMSNQMCHSIWQQHGTYSIPTLYEKIILYLLVQTVLYSYMML